MTRPEVANRVARLYDRRSLRSYVYWKVRTDPAYAAVAQRLPDRPLVDLGCGIGVLPLFLREHGFSAPIIGIDFDERKIDEARRTAARDVTFVRADARDPIPANHNVVLLDLLQYFDSESQQQILTNVAAAANEVAIIRQGIRDDSWRYRFTMTVDAVARTTRWIRGERLNFPSRDEVTRAFEGFESEVTPLWGRTAFNNYLFVFTKRAVARRPE